MNGIDSLNIDYYSITNINNSSGNTDGKIYLSDTVVYICTQFKYEEIINDIKKFMLRINML